MEQEIFLFGNSAYVTCKFLINRKVPQHIVYKNTAKSNKEGWFTRSHPISEKNRLIEYSSIPYHFIKEYNLPNFTELKNIAEINLKLYKKDLKQKNYKIIKNILDFEYSNWESLRSIYTGGFNDETKIEMYCKTHILLSKIVELKNLGFKLIDLYSSYCQYDGLIFENIRYSSFCQKIKLITKANCIENVLIHGLKDHLSNNRVKTEDIEIEIIKHFQNPKKLNAGQIHKLVNDYLTRMNRRTISISSIYNTISKINVKNEAMISRFGEQFCKNTMLPFAHFEPPRSEGILWMMDGTRFQFAHKDGKDKLNYLIYYVVLDAFNKKIIGYSFDDSENSEMVTRAIRNACENTMYLPREMIADNSPAYRTQEFTRIRALAKLMGVNWRIIANKNPTDNNYVERFFGVFQEKFCKKYDGYIGDGITSRNLNGRPSPEELRKYLTKKNLKTKQELVQLLDKMINEYNLSKHREQLMKKDELSHKNQSKKKIQPIPLNAINYSKLFHSSKELKVQHGMITFTINNNEYTYNIYDEDILLNYSGTRVRVRYNEKNFSKVMLFSLLSDEYICTLDRIRSIPKALIERDDIDQEIFNQHIKKSESLKNNLKKRIYKIEETSRKNKANLPPELVQFIPSSKPISENSEKEVINEELEKILEVERFITFKATYNETGLDEILENIFSKKGNLNPLQNGKN